MLPSTPTPPHFDEPRFEFTKRMELSTDDHVRLKALAEEHGLVFFSSPVLGRGGRAPRGGRRSRLQDRLRRGDEPAARRGRRRHGQAGAALDRACPGWTTSSGPPRPCATTGRRSSSCSARRTTRARPSSSTCARWSRWASGSASPYGLSDHTPGRLDVGGGGRARRSRGREALHALEAAVRARPPRVARPGGARAARRGRARGARRRSAAG